VYGAQLDGRRDDKVELVAYLLVSEGVDAEAAVMVGDRAADVLSAKANRVGSIGVLWGYGSEQELLDAGADVLCKTPSELAHLFSGTQSKKSLQLTAR
jgi:phosphoglycolate phosphatase